MYNLKYPASPPHIEHSGQTFVSVQPSTILSHLEKAIIAAVLTNCKSSMPEVDEVNWEEMSVTSSVHWVGIVDWIGHSSSWGEALTNGEKETKLINGNWGATLRYLGARKGGDYVEVALRTKKECWGTG